MAEAHAHTHTHEEQKKFAPTSEVKEVGPCKLQIRVEISAQRVKEEIDHATEWALDQAMPDPSVATTGVFAEADPELGDGEAPWSLWRDGHA